MSQQDGWFDDPYGQHDGRYFSQGQPTNRVRDGNRFFFEEPPTEPAPVAAEPGTNAPAGPEAAWYPDPTGPGLMRYWDGSQWTEQVMPAPGAGDVTAPGPVAVPDSEAGEGQGSTGASPAAPERVVEPVPVPIPAPVGTPAPITAAAEDTDLEGDKMKTSVAVDKAQAAVPLAEDLVDDTPPVTGHGSEQSDRPSAPAPSVPPVPSVSTPAGHASRGTPATTAVSAPTPATTVGRGAHYVLAPEIDRDEETETDGRGMSIVTGEVPHGYHRITVECEGGEVVEATILDPGTSGGVTLFVAPVRRHVRRIVATKAGGVYGIFLDVDQLEREGGGDDPGAAPAAPDHQADTTA